MRSFEQSNSSAEIDQRWTSRSSTSSTVGGTPTRNEQLHAVIEHSGHDEITYKLQACCEKLHADALAALDQG
jgi:hypothetical protein